MKLGWGWKIAILYGVFAVLIVSLVIASNRQHFDLVTDDYYGEKGSKLGPAADREKE